MPLAEAGAALLLLAAFAAALAFGPAEPGPGPLALCTAIAAAHAALVPRAGFSSLLLAVPALCAVSYGRPGFWPLPGSFLLVALAGLAGRVGRGRAYQSYMLLVFLLPFALHYLVVEFGEIAAAGFWRDLSPVAAAERVAEGAAPPAACVLLLLAWPVGVLARGRS
jgi:hypothetical protein